MGMTDFVVRNVLPLYLIAVILGLVFNNISLSLQHLIQYLIFLIIYFSSFKVPATNLFQKLKSWKGNLVTLLIHFILLPVLFMLISVKILRLDTLILAGIIFVFTLPTATTNVLYSNLLKGDSPYVLVMLLLTSLLSPIFTPLVFYLLTKNLVSFNVLIMFIKLVLIIVLPFILANLTSKVFSGIKKKADFFSSVSFIIVQFISAGVLYDSGILNNFPSLINILLVLALSFVLSFIVIFYLVKKFSDREYSISFALVTTRRNTSLGLGIAIGVLSPVVIGVLLLYQYVMDILGFTLMRYIK